MYACLKEKTLVADGNYRLISGKDCCAETAFAEFMATKASFKKTGDTQFYHYTQSFKVGENISPQTAHEIACKFAEQNYPGYEVLVATHSDATHIHSHFIINSVSFENGIKLHQPPNTLRLLRASSDQICQSYGFEILPTYTYGRSKTPSRSQRKAQARGNSWKDKLKFAVDDAMSKSRSKEGFVITLEAQGYKVKHWTDSRKSITYTCPNGKDCRDDRLQGERYLKVNMELEFSYRQKKEEPTQSTGWEHERSLLDNPVQQPNFMTEFGPKPMGRKLTDKILQHAKRLEGSANNDDEIDELMEIAALTGLSFVGVYILIEALNNGNKDKISDKNLTDFIEELKQEPENCIEYEDEQEQGFTMTMM